MKWDYIIVGQGIAGTVLADHLIQAGKKVLVYDNPSISNSSRVAGGLYNPITGRKMVKTWLADELFPYLLQYYRDLEQRLGVSFVKDIPIYRPFLSVEELNEWMGKSADPSFQPFIKEVSTSARYGSHINDGFGGILLDQSGYLNTSLLVETFRKYLLEKRTLIEQSFEPNDIEFSGTGVMYQGRWAQKLIFCDGPALVDNKFFDWLPLRPVKGELIFIEVSEPFRAIYNRGVFIIPLGNGLCKVGATYDHKSLNNSPTKEAKDQLIEKLDSLIRVPYEVVNQVAGIRPATRDRRPFIGIHPEFEALAVFGGMGTKGVSLAPHFARQFARSLTSEIEVMEEANIERFFSLY